MAAGIMSACLPTMRPALMFLFRAVGLKHLTSSWGSRGESKAANNSQSTRTVDGGIKGHMRNDSAFTRLHDGGSGDRIDWGSPPAAAALRPDNCSAMVTRVMGSPGNEESLEGDEVPLHTIRVQTEFKRSEK